MSIIYLLNQTWSCYKFSGALGTSPDWADLTIILLALRSKPNSFQLLDLRFSFTFDLVEKNSLVVSNCLGIEIENGIEFTLDSFRAVLESSWLLTFVIAFIYLHVPRGEIFLGFLRTEHDFFPVMFWAPPLYHHVSFLNRKIIEVFILQAHLFEFSRHTIKTYAPSQKFFLNYIDLSD